MPKKKHRWRRRRGSRSAKVTEKLGLFVIQGKRGVFSPQQPGLTPEDADRIFNNSAELGSDELLRKRASRYMSPKPNPGA